MAVVVWVLAFFAAPGLGLCFGFDVFSVFLPVSRLPTMLVLLITDEPPPKTPSDTKLLLVTIVERVWPNEPNGNPPFGLPNWLASKPKPPICLFKTLLLFMKIPRPTLLLFINALRRKPALWSILLLLIDTCRFNGTWPVEDGNAS